MDFLGLRQPTQKSLRVIVSPEAGSPVPPHGGRHQCHVPLPVAQRPPGNCGHSAAEDLQPGLHPFQQDLRSHQTVASRRHRGKSRGHPEASCRQNSRRYAHGDFGRGPVEDRTPLGGSTGNSELLLNYVHMQ